MTRSRPFFIAATAAAAILFVPSANAANTTPRMTQKMPQSFHHKLEIPNSTARGNNANNEDTYSKPGKKTRAERQQARQNRQKNKRNQNKSFNEEEARTVEATNSTPKSRRDRQRANRNTRAQQNRMLEKGLDTLSDRIND